MTQNHLTKMTKIQYLTNHYQKDKENFNGAVQIKTGLANLDNKLKIRNGVYLIGGLPSIGKTSFILQLSDTMASDGHDILFFSFEQSEYDLTEKSLNRIKNQYGHTDSSVIACYSLFADKITTITSSSCVYVEDVVEMIEDHIAKTGKKPIVFIDYLQLLQTKSNLGKRESTEDVSHKIVNIAKRHKLTVFVISSFNRANYMSPIDMESFKESGSLEYDADVVLGLQYQLISDQKFINCTSVDKKRILISQEKSKAIRDVELTCVKNRFGPVFESCKMEYHANKDMFVDSPTKPSKQFAANAIIV